MQELIQQRRDATGDGKEHHDLFSNLLAASEGENGALSDSELKGNVFIFMLAGHEVCQISSTDFRT
jgi:cytochrome P450